jgi:hypothetical protein
MRNRASLFQFGTTSADNLNSSYVFPAQILAVTVCFIPPTSDDRTASAHLFTRIRTLAANRCSSGLRCIGKTLGHGPILAPLTFRPRRLHKYYNPAAPWLVALNQINMQVPTTKETYYS